ncbi:hypothetical protein EV702DRAFT_1046910 [Suillus placidus]|uniref:Uncharacterized protein n=1 Tax=Suillus placidus TaxID=48579 RepID=A0A9P6ZSR6_9AGAM|nr:hypothetical protein EV702DRAFT_1046910 [Suillus placidus]
MAHNASNISLQAHLRRRHEAEPATGSASWVLPQAPTPLVAQKRVAEDLEGRNVKRVKRGSGGIKNDPFFKPVLDQHGQHDGTYVCSKDGTVIRPGSHKRHIKTEKHLGFKLELYTCPLCPETYTRRDACKRHWRDGCGKLAAEDASPVGVPTATSTSSLPTTTRTTPDNSLPETTLTEAIEDAPNPESRAANAIQDPALVAPVLPPSQVRQITLAEVHGDLDFWRWINEIEDFVDPALPISEPSSSRLPETILEEAAEDPDV